MRLTIDTRQVDAAAERLRNLPKQTRFATALALTRTAQRVAQAERAEMADVFDRPTPFTLRSVYVRAAKPAALEAEVGIKSDTAGQRSAVSWLRWQIKGGLRTQTAYERLLVNRGAMRNDQRAVPGRGARLDAYGNISRGQLVQILSQLRIDSSTGSTRSLTQFAFADTGRERRLKQNKIRRAYGRAGGQFVAFPDGRGRLLPGIYQATGRDFGARLGYGRTGQLKPVLIFVSKAQYEAERFDFYYVARLNAQRYLKTEIARAARDALATARA